MLELLVKIQQFTSSYRSTPNNKIMRTKKAFEHFVTKKRQFYVKVQNGRDM